MKFSKMGVIQILILITVTCTFTNCAPPIGSLWDSDENQNPGFLADSLWTTPLRMVYGTNPTNNAFRPAVDLLVFISFEGLTYEIPINEVDVQISNDILNEDPVYETVFDSDNNNSGSGICHRFTKEGRYLVRVAYQEKHSVPYSVQVGGIGSGGDGSSDGNGDGIQIVWRPLVTFESNGGSKVISQRIDYGSAAIEPEPPVKQGFIFGGWYENRNLTRLYDFNRPVIQSIILYAKWAEL